MILGELDNGGCGDADLQVETLVGVSLDGGEISRSKANHCSSLNLMSFLVFETPSQNPWQKIYFRWNASPLERYRDKCVRVVFGVV